jgi:hypothetical protein
VAVAFRKFGIPVRFWFDLQRHVDRPCGYRKRFTPTTTLFVQGKGGTNPFVVASSTGSAMLTVAQNGSTTLSLVGQRQCPANNGALFIGPISLTADVSGVLPLAMAVSRRPPSAT